jgi:hypothetical protein
MRDLANRILHSFSLVVTDRRWAAPLSAGALGFGIFAGVAIGPSAAGTIAGTSPIVELVGGGDESSPETSEGEGLGGALAGGTLEAPPLAPIEPAPLAPAPEAEAPAPKSPPPSKEEPAEEEGTELTGTVVHANDAAGSYALTIKGGELVPVHAAALPTPGTKLTVIAKQLANGSFGEGEKPKRTGKATEAELKGVVTYVDPDPADPAYTLSGRGASLLVHVDPDPSGAVPQLPVVGAYAMVTAAIEPDGKLRQREIEIEDVSPATYLDLAGIVGEAPPETNQLLLSADDIRESEADLTLTVPAKIDTKKLKPGDSYFATAEVQPDGSLALKGIASDEHRKGADDGTEAQGDLTRLAGASSATGPAASSVSGQ